MKSVIDLAIEKRAAKILGARGGSAGRGAAKARGSEKARAAANARWEKVRLTNGTSANPVTLDNPSVSVLPNDQVQR